MRSIDEINFFNNFYIGSYFYFSHMTVQDKTKLTPLLSSFVPILVITLMFIFTYIQDITLIDGTKLFVNINN